MLDSVRALLDRSSTTPCVSSHSSRYLLLALLPFATFLVCIGRLEITVLSTTSVQVCDNRVRSPTMAESKDATLQPPVDKMDVTPVDPKDGVFIKRAVSAD